MKGAILQKGLPYFTDMNAIMAPIECDALKYNWLVTECDVIQYPNEYKHADYTWLSGTELMTFLKQGIVKQFDWGVFSAIPKDITLNEVLQYPYPYADGYRGFWINPVSIQHPLAVIEIVPWDNSLVLLISKEDCIVERFVKHYPLSEDLEVYNSSISS